MIYNFLEVSWIFSDQSKMKGGQLSKGDEGQ